MKRRLLKNTQLFLLLGAAAGASGLIAASASELAIGLQASVTINGTAGAVYRIERSDGLEETGASTWRCLEYLQLPAASVVWTDKDNATAGKRFYRAIEQSAFTNMVFIPPNSFRMGGPAGAPETRSDETPQTVVKISRGFWMGKYEVTQREYIDVIGTNTSTITGDLSHPVESVSWHAATNYCAQLTLREQAAGRIPIGAHFRLPTEAEWEYAARAWISTQYHYGDDPGAALTASYAWIGDNSGMTSHPVGQKLPNPWGLYDMTGNVWEWCQDWYGSYPGGYQTDPTGPAESTGIGLGSYKVMRGGGFDYFTQDCRSARRLIFAPNLTDYDLGFRVVLAVNPG